jgi:hypothetical protein
MIIISRNKWMCTCINKCSSNGFVKKISPSGKLGEQIENKQMVKFFHYANAIHFAPWGFYLSLGKLDRSNGVIGAGRIGRQWEFPGPRHRWWQIQKVFFHNSLEYTKGSFKCDGSPYHSVKL